MSETEEVIRKEFLSECLELLMLTQQAEILVPYYLYIGSHISLGLVVSRSGVSSIKCLIT